MKPFLSIPRIKFISVLFMLGCAAGFCESVYLESSSSGIVKMDVAVLPFECSDKKEKRLLSEAPHGIVENDLILSGRFNTFRAKNPDTLLFREKNISVYVNGSYAYKKEIVVMSCSLLDARSQELIVGKKYEGTEKQLRAMMHRFSDEAVMTLFGEKGIAQTKIAFVKKTGKAKEIYVMDYDGFNQVPVTKNQSINLFPAFSPQNQEIAYVSYRNGKPDIWIYSFTTGKDRVFVSSAGLNSSPSWCPVESKIVFASSLSGNTEIYIKESGKDNKPLKITNDGSIDTAPTYSPTGYEIAFTSDRKGSPQIFAMDETGANLRRLTYSGKYNDSPAWSPKGDKIAYASLDEARFNIFTINIEGDDVKALTQGGGSNEAPSWSPDGMHIVFCSSRQGKNDIFVMNEDGTEQRQITFSGDCTMPSWSNYIDGGNP